MISMKLPIRLFAALALLAISVSPALAGISESLATLQSVGPEGEGNREAAAAWAELVETGPEALVPTLAAMDGASPLARNWMRAAAEAVFAEARQSDEGAPADELRSFLLDRSGDRDARTLAFDFYTTTSPDEAAALIPDMIDDPAPGLRREAVARLIERAETQLAAGQKDAAAETLRGALDSAREVEQIDAITKLLREKLEEPVDLPRQFGFLLYWHLLAPFDNTDREGFDAVYPPEESVDLTANYTGKNDEEISWREYSTADDYGMVDFNQPFGPLKEVVGYAYTEFDSPEEREAELRLGCKNAWKIWLNGELLFGRDEYHRGMKVDQYVLPVTLQKGKNTLLVKACQNEQTESWTVQWQFQLRVCDSTGAAILNTDRRPTPVPAEKPRRRPKQ